MICPNCKSRLGARLTLQHPDGYLYRQRRCEGCKEVFYTAEVILVNTDKVLSDIRMLYKMKKAGWSCSKQENKQT